MCRRRRGKQRPNAAARTISPTSAPTTHRDLPNPVLQRVLHACGRHTRRVCRHWRFVYGPLDCGLLLTHVTSRHDLVALPRRLSSLRTLALAALSDQPCPAPQHPHNPRSLMAALPRAFPRLASLDLDAAVLRNPRHFAAALDPHLAALTPLDPHLTALTLRRLDHRTQPLTALPTALPSLRSLVLSSFASFPTPVLRDICGVLLTLAALPNLQHLQCGPCCYTPYPTAAILPLLATLPPTLTHLDFRLCYLSPDHSPPDILPIYASLPGLQSLHLALDLNMQQPPAPESLDTLTTALSQRQALTALHLTLRFTPSTTSFPGIQHLSRLRNLRSLQPETTSWPVWEHLTPALLSHTTSLTRLSLHSGSRYAAPPVPGLWGALAPTVACLTWFCEDPPLHMVACLEQLTVLQSLTMNLGDRGYFDVLDDWEAAGGQRAVDAILSLTRLTHLDACAWRQSVGRVLLAGISRLRALRRLHISAVDDVEALSQLASVSSTLTRLELRCHSLETTNYMAAVRDLPCSVRYLVLHGRPPWWGNTAGDERDLLPLPGGLRVLVMRGAPLASKVLAGLEKMGRKQDCIVAVHDRWLDRELLGGCNGYLC